MSGNSVVTPAHGFPEIAPPTPVSGTYWVYILQSADGALYVGQTNHVPERLRKHRLGMGSKYTHDHPGGVLVFVDGPFDVDAAVKREAQLKRWSRAKKEALIGGELTRLHDLSQSRG